MPVSRPFSVHQRVLVTAFSLAPLLSCAEEKNLGDAGPRDDAAVKQPYVRDNDSGSTASNADAASTTGEAGASTDAAGTDAGDVEEPGSAATCSRTYTNPIIWEDLPDLEVIRVDDTYYYTASSFHQSPGAPLLRSYDLVHWEYLSHSVPVLDVGASYDLDGGRAYVNGIWASTLQYRKSNETFYWMGCMHNGGGGWVFTAKSPEGPWEKHRGGCYYDMGLLVDDDDKLYVAYGNNTIRVAQLTSDGFSEVRSQQVLETPSEVGGPLEGSRFYKKDGIYYIFMTQYAAGEWVMRSKNGPFGPYEGPREFAVRLPYAGAAGSGGSPHQGGIVQTQNGQWFYIGFNDAYPGGRIPVMIPVSWNDGWPSVQLVNGKFGGSYPFPDLPCGADKVAPRNTPESFMKPKLGPEWEWNHNPDDSKWSAGDGLTLKTATVTNDLYAARNTLTRRIEGPVSIATMELDSSGMQNGDVAGLAALRDRSAWIGVKKSGGATRIVMTTGIDMNTSWQTTSTGTEVASAELRGDKVWLRVEANIRTDSGGARASFSYSTDGVEFKALGNTLSMNKDWQFFLGYRFGIFNYATQSLGGLVKVRSFTLSKP
ncbi:MAG TPA: glycoside hydrolase 43 family protein [Polyangiales bacterium]